MSCGAETSLIFVMVRDLVNVVFQFKHLNIIIARLEMFVLFRDLHRKRKENFITSAIRAIGSFLFMRRGCKS